MYVLLDFPFLVVCFDKRLVLRVDTIRKRDEIFVGLSSFKKYCACLRRLRALAFRIPLMVVVPGLGCIWSRQLRHSVHELETYLHNKGEKSVQYRTLMCSELFDQRESLII